MGRITTLIEPFRIKAVEPIRSTTADERHRLLEAAHFNLFFLHSSDVSIDLLTDSGTGAMSAAQWGALVTGDEAYAGSESYFEFQRAVQDIFTMPEVIPTHQGRASERLLFSTVCEADQIVPNNTHFDTTRANLEVLGVQAKDLVIAEGRDTRSRHPFKGNMDVEALADLLERERHRIPFVLLTITNNSGGGQPVSLANVRAVKETARRFGVPLYLDCARFAENAWFIAQREEGQAGRQPIEIARDVFRLADGALMSAKKDGMVNIGGILALRDPMLASELRTQLILTEGFPTYGGLAGRDLAALAKGLYEALDPSYLRYRIRTAEYMAERMRDAGVPIMEPPGGHAIYVDAAEMLPHLDPLEFPAHSLACAMYLFGGIRGVEIGSVMFGAVDEEGRATPAPHELLRLAFPRRVYTQSHFDYVAEVAAWVAEVADELPGMEIVHEPPYLRHFTAHFRPKAPFPRPADLEDDR